MYIAAYRGSANAVKALLESDASMQNEVGLLYINKISIHPKILFSLLSILMLSQLVSLAEKLFRMHLTLDFRCRRITQTYILQL